MTHEYIQLNRETYDKIAKLFAQTRQYLWDDLMSFLTYTKDNQKILDIGCGTGRLYHLFKKIQGIDYIGIDQSEGQIREAQKDFPENNYIVGEMTTLPFENEIFDVVFCIATLHHLPDEMTRLQAIREMKRVLKKGGYICMTNWNLFSHTAQKTAKSGKYLVKNEHDFIIPWKSPEGVMLAERYYHGFSLEELEDLYIKAGLKIVEQYYSKKGEISDIKKGHNIVTVLQKIDN